MNDKIRKRRMKTLNESMEWIYGQSPKDGHRYWVACYGEVSISVADEDSDTGWAGPYTGLDINGVEAYKKLETPLFKV